MKTSIILDTGPLVAFIDTSDRFHSWSVQVWTTLSKPLFTCEAVITEACFLVKNVYKGEDTVMELINDGLIEIPFHLNEEVTEIRELMKRYQSVPMSLADACLVRMSELIKDNYVLTLDSDFRIYRRNKKEAIELIIAEDLSI